MAIDYQDLVSPRLYDRESAEFGLYKCLRYLGNRKYLAKFKNTGNEQECGYLDVKKNVVKDKKKIKYDKDNLKKEKERQQKQEKKAIERQKKLDEQKEKEEKRRLDFEETCLINPDRILVLDMATKITGYKAVFGNEFIKGWFVDLDKKVENRIVYMFKEIKEIIEELNIDSVVIESIPLKGGLSVTLALAQLRGAIICHCVTNNIQWVDVNPVAWEKHYWEKTIDKTEEDQKEFDNLVIYDKKTKKYKNDTKEKTLWIYNKKHETDLEQDCRIKVDMQLATNKITLKEKARLLQKGHACWYDVADCDGLWQYVKDKRIIRR